MTVLALLLLADAALHAAIVYRFGARENMPFAVFAVVDLVLAIAVFLAWPYALWVTLILTLIGIVGLTATFNRVPRDKSFDYMIWAIDAVIILVALYFLFLAGPAPASA